MTVGIGFLLTPGVVLVVLLGIEQAPTETLFVGRITGTAILGIGLASWLMRNDTSQASRRNVITGIMVYTTPLCFSYMLAYPQIWSVSCSGPELASLAARFCFAAPT